MSLRVAVIGGGPAGLAAAKALALEPAKFSIDLLERRDKIGGLWYYGGDKTKIRPPVPSSDPNGKEVLDPNGGFENRFFSPMYKHLETNLICRMMEYKDVPFPLGTTAFPNRSEVLAYLVKYSETIPSEVNFRLNTNVSKITKTEGVWNVETEDEFQKVSNTPYDAVVVANGHFDMPFIPETEGVKEWNEKSPGAVTHAKYFDDATLFADKTVLVVGNYASGVDLATQISTTAKHVYVSMKDPAELIEVEDDRVQHLPLVTKYDYDNGRSAYTVDGRVVSGIDSIVFCTGYLYSFPFLRDYLPDLTDGSTVYNVYRQIFNVDDPTLSFIELPKFVVPMPLAEAQSAIVARVLSGRLQLPDVEERRKAYLAELEEKGSGKAFHSLKPPADFDYCNELYNWIVSEKVDSEGLVPIQWGEQKKTDRLEAKDLKDARMVDVVKHAARLREQGKSFELLP